MSRNLRAAIDGDGYLSTFAAMKPSRATRGWSTLISGVGAVGASLYGGLRANYWYSNAVLILGVICVANLVSYRRLVARDKKAAQNNSQAIQSSEPTLSSVTPPAGQESRPR
jgi:glucose uptake protein GlcU